MDTVREHDYARCFAALPDDRRCSNRHKGTGFCKIHARLLDRNGSVRVVSEYDFWLWENEETPAWVAQRETDNELYAAAAVLGIGQGTKV